jgi:hypothetical protein
MMIGLVAMALGLAAPAVAQEGDPVDVTAACQSAVEGMKALTADVELPDHLVADNPARSADDFDVSSYFTVLDRLSVEDGYRMDYVYHFGGGGGAPVLYTQPEDETPYLTVRDYSEALHQPKLNIHKFPDYRERIVIEDTPEGYMQMVVLDVMAEQFYLFWHSNVNDWEIVCNEEMLETLLDPERPFGDLMPDEVRTQARGLDLTPTVEIGEDTARVQVIMFTQWQGFLRVTTTIDRAYPREVYESGNERLVEYDSGVRF